MKKGVSTRDAIKEIETEIRQLEIKKQCESSPYKCFQIQQEINKRSSLLSVMRTVFGDGIEGRIEYSAPSCSIRAVKNNKYR